MFLSRIVAASLKGGRVVARKTIGSWTIQDRLAKPKQDNSNTNPGMASHNMKTKLLGLKVSFQGCP